jgi:exopolysaccharide biosynthesis protein
VIGYYEPGHYAFVIVDGRTKYYSEGMTFTEVSAFMAELGCKVAYNLDGGQSAQMVLEDNLVNMPANGGRRVGDIIYLERMEPEA